MYYFSYQMNSVRLDLKTFIYSYKSGKIRLKNISRDYLQVWNYRRALFPSLYFSVFTQLFFKMHILLYNQNSVFLCFVLFLMFIPFDPMIPFL